MRKLTLLIIISMFLVSLVLYPSLPAILPTHWNIHGVVDSYAPKSFGAWFLPVLTLVMWVAFRFLPQLDPNKKKYKLFAHEWEIMQTALITFFAYLHFVIFYIVMHPGTSILPLMFIGFGILFILLGNYLSKIRQNYFIGFKLPWTLANEDNWNKTHRLGSWLFVFAGLIALVEAYAGWHAPEVFFGSIMLAAILPSIYSFLLYKKQADKMKYVYLSVGLAILALLTIVVL